jgi:hypothetical protein
MRVTVHNERQYLEIIRQTWRENCFYGVFSEMQKKERIFDTVYLEQDYSSMMEANKDYDVLTSHFKMQGIVARTYFSGRRSYHYFVDFPPIKITNFKEKVRTWAASLPIKFDTDVVGDTGRMTRLPGSQHEKTHLFCVPVNSVVNPSSCVDLTNVKVPDIVPNILFGNMLKDLKAETQVTMGVPHPEIVVKGGPLPPCVLSIMRMAVNTGQCDHNARLHVGTYLLRTEGKKAAYNFFKASVTDFNHQTTTYNLNWLIEHDWHCYVCSRAKEFGLCPLESGKVCNFYPSINWHL